MFHIFHMFHMTSQSFYTPDHVTSNPSCSDLDCLPDTVWPTVDMFGCQNVSSQAIPESPGSGVKLQLPVLSSTSCTHGLTEPTHTPIYVSYTYF